MKNTLRCGIAFAFVSFVLAGCGGGGGGGGETAAPSASSGTNSQGGGAAPPAATPPANSPATPTPASPAPDTPAQPAPGPSAPQPSPPPSSGGSSNTGGGSPTSPPQTSFSAYLSIAPAPDAGLFDIVTLEVRGSGIRNVELVPPDTAGPVIARFDVLNDTVAVLHLDTRTMLNGVLAARIVAYDAPPGQPGSSIEVMGPRQWRLVNDPQPPLVGAIPPANYRPLVIIHPRELPYVDPAPLRALYQLDDAALTARLASDGPAIQALMDRYQTTQVYLEPTGIDGSGQGEWFYCRRNLTLVACRGGFMVMEGRMLAKAQ